MSLLIEGYVLESCRVGASNSAFTYTPNVVISDQAAFDAAYPSDESEPRTEYHVMVLLDGNLEDAVFGWTKNEILTRFGYDGRLQRFKTLPGIPPTAVGVLALDSNTVRLACKVPASSDFSLFPLRLFVGSGSGTTFTVSLVDNDGDFTSPSSGTVELSLSSGNLNWAIADLTTYEGQDVGFQQQQFSEDTQVNIGAIEDILLLSPKPASGQIPLLRIGQRSYLTAVEVATEVAFSPNPSAGTVEWALTTGRLKFNSTEISTYSGTSIYYDGCLFGELQVIPDAVGTVLSPTSLSPLPDEESAVFFTIPGVRFPETLFVDTFSAEGKKGRVEIRRSDGAIQLSSVDITAYGLEDLTVWIPDLLVERGISIRWFRNPVNLDAADPTLKDVTSLYSAVGVLADPIIAFPKVRLPAPPLEDQALSVDVEQGTGSYEGNLPRLDVASPPLGLGVTIDQDTQELSFANRTANVILGGDQPYGAVQLPDPLVFDTNLLLELETAPNSGIYSPLVVDEDAVIQLSSGLVELITTVGTLVTSGDEGSFSGTNFNDTTVDFVALGVQQEDILIVEGQDQFVVVAVAQNDLTTNAAGATSTGLSYEIRRDKEVLVDRFFRELPPLDPNTTVERILSLGIATNSPRLQVPTTSIEVTRVRLGKTVYCTTTTVADDGAFTAPGSLASGTVEVSLDTGNLNFSSLDLGLTAYWVRELVLGTEYRVQPGLSFIELKERLLEQEEVLVQYNIVDSEDNRVEVSERAAFLVRKELVQDHPIPTSTLSFNPDGREIAEVSPRAFRGGRPQVTGTNVSFDLTISTITFLAGTQTTTVIPGGATVAPTERIYVDYFIHEALGGETTFTLQQKPMLGFSFTITEGEDTFTLPGDRTNDFLSDYLLLVNSNELYLVSGSSYDSGVDRTTITLAVQTFRSDLTTPPLAISSGPTRTTPSPGLPSYFTIEAATFDDVPKGSSTVVIHGDVHTTYVEGTVLFWSDDGDLDLVGGSSYSADTDRTTVKLNGTTARQRAGAILKRSVRAILKNASALVRTSRVPITGLPFTLFRAVEGETGVILDPTVDYKADSSGTILLAAPLGLLEEVSALYSGSTIISDGRTVRASYVSLTAPSSSNGLLGQILKMTYTTYAPDTIYWRVETITNFRGELAEQYEADAKASVPTNGPRLSNGSTLELFEQGRESVFFQERRLSNEDQVAIATLKFFNDGVNYIEDALQDMDGRVVGDHDGRFIFDGVLDNPDRTTFQDVTNQIDDLLKVSDSPVVVTGPPFVTTFVGTYQEVYLASPQSRFYPTSKGLYGAVAAGSSTGDTILDTGQKNLQKVNSISRRIPWSITTSSSDATDTGVEVDTTDGALELLRPALDDASFPDMKVSIIGQDGTILVSDVAPLTISSVTSTTITFTTPIGVDIPIGSTVRHVLTDASPPATPYLKFYRPDYDVGVSLEAGVLTYIVPFPPLDGTVPTIPVELNIQTPTAGEVLDVDAQVLNLLTEPMRAPVFDGGTEDDDGNRQFPLLTPSIDSENSTLGYLPRELAVVEIGGTLRNITTEPFVGTGDLDGTALIITNSGGPWPVPAPKLYDLVKITSGLNAAASFRRIVAVGASTVTVNTAYSFVDTGFNFTITVSNSLVIGAAGTIAPTTRLTDGAVNFIASGVEPGHTVVVTSGPLLGQRRQVTAVVSATELDVVAFTTTDAGLTYRVDDPLGTFGGTNSIVNDELGPALTGQIDVIELNTPPGPWSETLALEFAVENFAEAVVTSSTGETTISSALLTDLSVDFEALGVLTTDLLWIRSGDNAGVFGILSIDSTTTLTTDSSFPATVSGMTYKIIRLEQLTRQGLEAILGILLEADDAYDAAVAFKALVATTISVSGDAPARATLLSTVSLNAREAQITNRMAQLDDAVAELEEILTAREKLYDKRFIWIDTRINLMKGTLPKRARALQQRLQAEANLVKQLTKLLTV